MSAATALGSLGAFGIIATSSPALEADCRPSTSAGESMGTLERRRGALDGEAFVQLSRP